MQGSKSLGVALVDLRAAVEQVMELRGGTGWVRESEGSASPTWCRSLTTPTHHVKLLIGGCKVHWSACAIILGDEVGIRVHDLG